MDKPKKPIAEFMLRSRYLPSILKDFHNAKDIFKWLHVYYPVSASHEPLPDWCSGMIYVIDYFLHAMARCGWTLQRSRQPYAFSDLDEFLKLDMEQRHKAFAQMLAERNEATAQPMSIFGQTNKTFRTLRLEQAVALTKEIEQHCPCGARPESLSTHPHVTGCPVEKLLRTLDVAIVTESAI